MDTITGSAPFTLSIDEDGDFTLSYGGGGTIPPAPAALIPNSASAIYTVNEDLSVTIPIDGTTPQNTEGTQIVSVTMSAQSATSKVRIQFDAYGGHVTHDNALIAALFIDSEVNARRCMAVNPPGPGYVIPLRLVYEWTPGDAAPHTYKVRVGSSYGVMRLNGWGNGDKLAGTSAATLLVDEILSP